MHLTISPEIRYMLLVFGLFIVPRALQRYRLPSAVTCVAIGAVLSIGFGQFHDDHTVKLLATLGIVSMFLFAGLEVDFEELRQNRRVLVQHLLGQLYLLVMGGLTVHYWLGLEPRAALLFALALFTPSTGFILDSLDAFGLTPDERFWVKSKAIASELVALAVLFFAVQSTDFATLAPSTFALGAMALLLPPVFGLFDRLIVPFAANTEFTFLVLLALLCAYITRELGVYYLVGAFVVGLTAVRLRKEFPKLSSPKLTGGVELFASFFIPFYFLNAGLHLRPEQFSLKSLSLALVLLVVVLPLRVLPVALQRKLALKEDWSTGIRIGTAVVPTLVFTIVIAEILQERFKLGPELFGSLIVFTLVNTLLPGFALGAPVPEYETPEFPTPSQMPPPMPSDAADDDPPDRREVG